MILAQWIRMISSLMCWIHHHREQWEVGTCVFIEIFMVGRGRQCTLFFYRIYTKFPLGLGDDKLSWRLYRSGHFDFRSFYNAIDGNDAHSFPRKSVWWVKVPKRVSFLLWWATWGKILTIDNLIKRGLLRVNWCCMCRCSGEKVDYLLIHCEIA